MDSEDKETISACWCEERVKRCGELHDVPLFSRRSLLDALKYRLADDLPEIYDLFTY